MFHITRRQIAYLRVRTLAIVVYFDVVEGLFFDLGQSRPRVQVDEFFLDGGVELFSHRVVEANPGMSNRRDNSVRQRQITELAARVLATAVGINDDTTEFSGFSVTVAES